MAHEKFDLRKYLKGHQGEYFYNTSFDAVQFIDIVAFDESEPAIHITYTEISETEPTHIYLNIDGSIVKNGPCVLFPSANLFERYPLMPELAWEMWENSKNVKYFMRTNIELCETHKGIEVIKKDLGINTIYFDTKAQMEQAMKHLIEYIKNI